MIQTAKRSSVFHRCQRGGRLQSLQLVCLMATLTLCSGCYEKQVNGDQTVYTFATYIQFGVPFLSFLLIPLGMAVLKLSQKWGWVCMLMSPVLLFVVAPAMFLDYLTVDSKGFQGRYGSWFSPTTFNVQFDDLELLRRTYQGGGKSLYLECVFKDGQKTMVSAGDLIQYAVPEILQRAKAAGVNVPGR